MVGTPEMGGLAAHERGAVLALHEVHHIRGGQLTHAWHPHRALHLTGARRMKAARIHGYNAAPVLEDVPMPTAGPGEVRVRIAAASLNPLDVKLQQGVMHGFFPLTFPYTLGTDLAGTIVQVGPGVTRWREGDAVIARTDATAGGALAEYAVVPASYLVRAPASVPLRVAAGIPTTAGTALQALVEMAALQPGQVVLVHGGAGGVGSFAIQFAREAGARVVATASGDGLDVARRLGAHEVIDYRAEDFAARLSGLDIVLDTIGGDTQERSFGVLRAGGILISTISPPDEARSNAHHVSSAFVVHMSNADRLEQVTARVRAGTTVLVDRTVPLHAVTEAFARQSSGRAQGKILVTA